MAKSSPHPDPTLHLLNAHPSPCFLLHGHDNSPVAGPSQHDTGLQCCRDCSFLPSLCLRSVWRILCPLFESFLTSLLLDPLYWVRTRNAESQKRYWGHTWARGWLGSQLWINWPTMSLYQLLFQKNCGGDGVCEDDLKVNITFSK